MTVPKSILKSYYVTGAKPTQSQFSDFIDAAYAGKRLYQDILTLSASGSQATYSLNNTSITTGSHVFVFVNGIYQIAGIHYNVVSNQVVFSSPITAGYSVVAIYLIDL